MCRRRGGRGGGALNTEYITCGNGYILYFSSQVLLLFTLFYLLLGVLSNWLHHAVIISTLKRVKIVLERCVMGVQGGIRRGERERGGKRRERGKKLLRSLITL